MIDDYDDDNNNNNNNNNNSNNNNNNNKLCRGHGIPPTAVISVEQFHILNHVASGTRALICLVILIFDLETDAHASMAMGGQPSYQFRYFLDVSFSTYGPTLAVMSSSAYDR